MIVSSKDAKLLNKRNKLGWAEPHSRFPLSFPINSLLVTFYMLWGQLYLRSSSIVFEYDPISGCWDIPLFIFWGHLPLEVLFFLRILKMWFGHLSLSLKLEYDPTNGCWDINILIFYGCFPLKVIFILRICKILFGHLKYKLWEWLNKWLLSYSTFNVLRSSSFRGLVKYDLVI